MNISSSNNCSDLDILENESYVESVNGRVLFVTTTDTDKFLMVISLIINAITITVGSIGNVLVICLVGFVKVLRKPPNIQLASLSVADLIACAIAAPIHLRSGILVLTNSYKVCDDFNLLMCTLMKFFYNFSLAATLVTLLTTSILRAVIVRGRLFSSDYKKRVVSLSIILSYTCGIGYGLYVLIIRSVGRVCFTFFASAKLRRNKVFPVLQIAVIGVSTVLIVCYGYIYWKHRKSQRAIHAFGENSSQQAYHVSQSNTMNIATSRICFSVVVTFFAVYLPNSILFVAHVATGHPSKDASPFTVYLATSFWLLGSAINPIIYSFQSKTFKQELRKLSRWTT
ncbi:melanopsin-B-like [Glandiceps talaboti]